MSCIARARKAENGPALEARKISQARSNGLLAGNPNGTFEREAGRVPGRSACPTAVEALQRAAAEPSSPIDASVREALESRFAHDFSRIRVHGGAASLAVAEGLGARAYTLGTDIHLGAEAHSLAGREFQRLMAHEAVHAVQQGGRPEAPQAALTVSNPADGAEQEARRIAESITAGDTVENPSSPPAPRLEMRASLPGQRIERSATQQIQRDLTGKKTVHDGDFDLNLKTESHPGAKNGMSGTIKFTASDKAPDSNHIRLLQTIRNQDLTTGKEYVWTGGEANRNKVMTAAATGIEPGFHVDQSYSKISPRGKRTDAAISPYYIDYENSGAADNYDGSKKGKAIKDASLWDYPGSSGKRRFSFETAAKGADTGYIYATLTWGFTISDPAKGTVDTEHADAHRGPSATFGAAVKSFNEFFKNPGASTAP